VVAEVLAVLQRMFGLPDKKFPPPVDFIVTRWQDDPFARGSYSFPAVNAFDDDTEILRTPHPAENPRVLFAGEYVSKAYFQCVDGAFDTGLRAAECVAHEGLHLPLPPREDRTPLALDVFTGCLSSRQADACSEFALASPAKKREANQEKREGNRAKKEGKRRKRQKRRENELSLSTHMLTPCPFTGFPVPSVPTALRGYYITDMSDAGLTDGEGSGPELSFSLSAEGRRCSAGKRAELELCEERFLRRCLEFLEAGGEEEKGKGAKEDSGLLGGFFSFPSQRFFYDAFFGHPTLCGSEENRVPCSGESGRRSSFADPTVLCAVLTSALAFTRKEIEEALATHARQGRSSIRGSFFSDADASAAVEGKVEREGVELRRSALRLDEQAVEPVSEEFQELRDFLAFLGTRDPFARRRLLLPLWVAAQSARERRGQVKGLEEVDEERRGASNEDEPQETEASLARETVETERGKADDEGVASCAASSPLIERRFGAEGREQVNRRARRTATTVAEDRLSHAESELDSEGEGAERKERQRVRWVYLRAAEVLTRHARAAAFLPSLSPVGLASFLVDSLPRLPPKKRTGASAKSGRTADRETLRTLREKKSRNSDLAAHATRAHTHEDAENTPDLVERSRSFPPSLSREVSPECGNETRMALIVSRSQAERENIRGDCGGVKGGCSEEKTEKNSRSLGVTRKVLKGARRRLPTASEFKRELENRLLHHLARSAFPSDIEATALRELLRAAQDERDIISCCHRRQAEAGKGVAKKDLEVQGDSSCLSPAFTQSIERQTTQRSAESEGGETASRYQGLRSGLRGQTEEGNEVEVTGANAGDEREFPHAGPKSGESEHFDYGSEDDFELREGGLLSDSEGEKGSYHERLCWMCGVGGDLLLCDGEGDPDMRRERTASREEKGSSTFVTLSRELAANEERKALPSFEIPRTSASQHHLSPRSQRPRILSPSPRRCRRVFHLACIFPPPTDEELQQDAVWRCPVCRFRSEERKRASGFGDGLVPSSLALHEETASASEHIQESTPEPGEKSRGRDESQRRSVQSFSFFSSSSASSCSSLASSSSYPSSFPPAVSGSVAKGQGGTSGAQRAVHTPRELRRFGTLSSLALHRVSLKKLFVEEVKCLLSTTRRVRRRFDFLARQRERREAVQQRKAQRRRCAEQKREEQRRRKLGKAAKSAPRGAEADGERVGERNGDREDVGKEQHARECSEEEREQHQQHTKERSEEKREGRDGCLCQPAVSSEANGAEEQTEGKVKRRKRGRVVLAKNREGERQGDGEKQETLEEKLTVSEEPKRTIRTRSSVAVRPATNEESDGEKSEDENGDEDLFTEDGRPVDPFLTASKDSRFAFALQVLNEFREANAVSPCHLPLARLAWHIQAGCRCCTYSAAEPGDEKADAEKEDAPRGGDSSLLSSVRSSGESNRGLGGKGEPRGGWKAAHCARGDSKNTGDSWCCCGCGREESEGDPEKKGRNCRCDLANLEAAAEAVATLACDAAPGAFEERARRDEELRMRCEIDGEEKRKTGMEKPRKRTSDLPQRLSAACSLESEKSSFLTPSAEARERHERFWRPDVSSRFQSRASNSLKFLSRFATSPFVPRCFSQPTTSVRSHGLLSTARQPVKADQFNSLPSRSFTSRSPTSNIVTSNIATSNIATSNGVTSNSFISSSPTSNNLTSTTLSSRDFVVASGLPGVPESVSLSPAGSRALAANCSVSVAPRDKEHPGSLSTACVSGENGGRLSPAPPVNVPCFSRGPMKAAAKARPFLRGGQSRVMPANKSGAVRLPARMPDHPEGRPPENDSMQSPAPGEALQSVPDGNAARPM
ncbi:histone lysine-specific demethylase LSD1/BHC110/KDMA1A, partial [Toxoplasma gondii ARI]